ncbi:MAG: hypothetical protein ACRDCW_03865 [Sarcina sp.]
MGFKVDNEREKKVISLIERLVSKIENYEEIINILEIQRINLNQQECVYNYKLLSTEILFSFPIMHDSLNKAFQTNRWEKNIHQYMKKIDIELKKIKI